MKNREINNNRKKLSFLSLAIAKHQNSDELCVSCFMTGFLKKLSFWAMFRSFTKGVFRQVAGQKSFWRPKVVIPVINPVILVILQLKATQTNNKHGRWGMDDWDQAFGTMMDRAKQQEQEGQRRWDATLQRLADEWNDTHHRRLAN